MTKDKIIVEPTEPVKPVEVIEPVEPTEPVEPKEPKETVEPVDTTEPAKPAESTEPVDPVKPVEPVEPVIEDNVKKIEEQLSVISEVRTELANSYATQKSNNKTIEQLQSQIKSLESNFGDSTKTIEKLSKELDSYKARDEEASNIAFKKRLEHLSSNFRELGQDKTVEQLSALSEDVITEFESVTSMALNHKSEEKLDTVTMPTQAIKTQQKVVQKVPEKLSDKDFMKGVLETLASQQNKEGSEGKRILRM